MRENQNECDVCETLHSPLVGAMICNSCLQGNEKPNPLNQISIKKNKNNIRQDFKENKSKYFFFLALAILILLSVLFVIFLIIYWRERPICDSPSGPIQAKPL